MHRQFVRTAVRHPFRPCIYDANSPTKKMFRYGEVLVGAKIMIRLLRPILGDEKMVGVWLPPGIAGVLTNAALTMLHKIPVNLNYSATPEVRKGSSRIIASASSRSSTRAMISPPTSGTCRPVSRMRPASKWPKACHSS